MSGSTRTPGRHGRRRLVAAVVAAAVLAACADGGDDPQAAEPTPPADAGAAASAEITLRNIAFEPADVEVAAGSTVTWTNADVVRHTVTSGVPGEADGTFDAALDSEGETFAFTFDTAGAFAYYCELHRSMVGTVSVSG